jgi:predicted RNase H-like HicB family nuclease
MFCDYVRVAMQHATYKQLPDSGTYYGEISGLQGVWANASTREECEHELNEVLQEWIVFRIASHLDVPPIDGMELVIAREAA